MNIEKIGLIISFICIIFLFIDRKKNIEKFDGHVNAEQSDVSLDEKINNAVNNALANRNTEDVKKIVNDQYNMDIEAIRNLGTISKSLLTGTNYHNATPGEPGKLTIPANMEVKGWALAVPIGTIILWVKDPAPEPSWAWAICDGNNGTPNLSDRYPLGHGSLGNTKSIGGGRVPTSCHKHTVGYGGTHSHSESGHRSYGLGGGRGGHGVGASHPRRTGNDGNHNHGMGAPSGCKDTYMENPQTMPPYAIVKFYMRIK